MDELLFDAATHTYSMCGTIIPSVTQILQDVGIVDYSDVPESVLEGPRIRGVDVHQICQWADTGELNLSSVDDEYIPYLDAWTAFKRDTGIFIIENEKPVFSFRHRFAGTPDRIGMMDYLTLVDIKTTSGKINPSTAIQSAAYELAFNELRAVADQVKRRIGVLLKPDGKYKVEPYNDRNDPNVFLSSLNIYNWKRRNQNGK